MDSTRPANTMSALERRSHTDGTLGHLQAIKGSTVSAEAPISTNELLNVLNMIRDNALVAIR
jgi:hypothetical protein